MSPYGNFGSAMHVGMGVVYLALAGFVIYSGHFGTGLPLSQGQSYAVGGLMALYGLFRLYRGIVQMRRQRSR